LNSLLFFKFGR